MSDLTVLKAIRANITEPDRQTVDRARALLEEAFGDSARELKVSRRPRRRWVIVPSAVAAAATLLVIGSLTIGFGAPADAASILNSAASISPSAVDPVLAKGQYLAIQTTTEGLFQAGVDGHDPSWKGATAAWVEKGTDTLYVPADRDATWVWVRGTDVDKLKHPAVAYFGSGAEAARTAWFSTPRLGPNAQPVWYLAAGAEPGTDGTAAGGSRLGIDPRSNQMPRNGRLLLAWFRIQAGTLPVDPSNDATVFGTIAQDLRWGLEPADLRASMLRALALMPGVRVDGALPSSTAPDATLSITALGHTQKLTLDTKSGRVIATETIDPHNFHGVDLVPDNIPTNATTVTTSIVDGLPPVDAVGIGK